MPAINFKKEFAPAVEAGTKLQTIRQARKRPIKVGDTVYLYTGMRTSGCRKLGEGTVESVEKVYIIDRFNIVMGCEHIKDSHAFALADGFKNEEDFYAFFQDHYGLPFEGMLIKWRLKNKRAGDQFEEWLEGFDLEAQEAIRSSWDAGYNQARLENQKQITNHREEAKK